MIVVSDLKVGTALAGVLRTKNAPLVEFLGEVIRQVEDELVAVRFLYLAEADQEQISRVISRTVRPQTWSVGERKTKNTLTMWPRFEPSKEEDEGPSRPADQTTGSDDHTPHPGS